MRPRGWLRAGPQEDFSLEGGRAAGQLLAPTGMGGAGVAFRARMDRDDLKFDFLARIAIIDILYYPGLERRESVDTVSVSRLKNELSEFLNQAAYGGKRIVVTSHDKPKAAVISVEDLELLKELEDAQSARETLAAYRAGETVSWEQVKAEMAAAERVPS